MSQVLLAWTPSVSTAVDLQRVRIYDVETQTAYGEADLDPTASQFAADCPEGRTVQGVVVTVRGTDEVAAQSNTLQVPYAPLVGATDLVLSIPAGVLRRR